MQTDNVFHLVHRFGAVEDQISANFGFILKANLPVLRSFLRQLRVPLGGLTAKDLAVIDVETQVPYTGKEAEQSRIDLQVRLPGEFIVFVESKLQNTPLGKDQLGKYAKILHEERQRHEHVRLVLVTQFDRRAEAQKWEHRLRRQGALKGDEFVYLRWEQVRRMLARQPADGRTRLLNELFLDYVGDMMGDKKIIADQVIRKVREVMIAPTDPDFWDLAMRRQVVAQDNNTPDARYVAFYRLAPTRAITHVAEVESTECNVIPKNILGGFPKLLKKAKERGWINKPTKVYRLKAIVELAFPIRKRPGGAPFQRRAFKTMSELLQARYLDDLFLSKR